MEAQACLLDVRERKQFIQRLYNLLQEPMKFVLKRQAKMVELLFMFADQYLNVNKILNSITSSFIAIVSENLD